MTNLVLSLGVGICFARYDISENVYVQKINSQQDKLIYVILTCSMESGNDALIFNIFHDPEN